ncbi:hypothetical protein [Flavobacterium gelidilacus]|uniref:hypothetical protein n=1 Tax=Flavobacterium gelidilacus TaxID=206041 RepID=UPI00041CB12D|nr:hypothetical protein [Flavobacterium gelidilacus]
MKFLILLFFVFQSFLGFSQRGGGGGGGGRSGGGRQQNQSPPKEDNKDGNILEETNIKEFAGLQHFDSKLVIKELKIKIDEEKETIESLFGIYNNRIKEIEKEDLLLIENTDLETRIIERKAIQDKDIKAMFEAKRRASIALEPVTNKTLEAKKVLNQQLEAKLSAKSYKKWLKYFEKNYQIEKPPLPKENNSGDNSSGRPPRR